MFIVDNSLFMSRIISWICPMMFSVLFSISMALGLGGIWGSFHGKLCVLGPSKVVGSCLSNILWFIKEKRLYILL